ncbi:GH25 family lysozyme [Rothia koreensis]|uniref:GH25 family lysozyme n=1 Tax=Rothia koreensis TaxID=592378 RepID=UPI003FCEB15D
MFESETRSTSRRLRHALRRRGAACLAVSTALILGGTLLVEPAAQAASDAGPKEGIQGRDISVNQGNDYPWSEVASAGVEFGQAQATDGDWASPTFDKQYKAIGKAGLYRGAYHFARPSHSSGSEQARFFMDHGGKWVNDGTTLPGMVDLEPTPSAKTADEQCYHQTPAQMRAWIQDFTVEYKSETGRAPMIYTTNAWWNQCVGDTTAFIDSPLMIAKWGSGSSGDVPASWGDYDFWQHTESSKGSIADRSRFNGPKSRLQELATNPQYVPTGSANKQQSPLGY